VLNRFPFSRNLPWAASLGQEQSGGLTYAKLTLRTDGVVEARNAAGKLFGFVRAAAISRESAEKVAQDAQHLGQETTLRC
jgi:hypothetical protein